MTCPECGATNPKGAEWCSLCTRPLVEPATDPVPEVAPVGPETIVETDEIPPAPSTDESAEGPIWACGTCGEANPIDDDVCGTCGTSIFEAHGATSELAEDRARAEAKAWVPGAGQSALGDPATGGMVVAVIALSVLFGALLLIGGGATPAGISILLIGMAAWGVGWYDTQQRLSRGMALLTPGRLLAVAGIIIVIVLFATTSATGA